MELKPCPFCGGKARVTGSFEVYGECRECGAEGEHFYARPIYGDSEEAAKKKAIEAWNRRTVGWISVKERLPEMGQTVVCAVYGTDLVEQEDGEMFVDALRRNRKHAHIELGYLAEDGWNEWEGYPMMVSPSYWMPFPDIPMPEVEDEKS